MIEELILLIAFVYLLITSILDIKYRLVWDYINYSFGALFLLIRILELIITANTVIFLGVLLASIATFAVGLILYKSGAWGGGDLKLLTALSIGLFFLPSDTISIGSLSFPFYANFLINTLFSGIIFGLAWSYYLFLKTKTYKELKKIHAVILLIALVLFALIFFVGAKEKILFSLLILFCLYYIIKVFENKITIINKDVKKLDEGDWIRQDIELSKKITISNNNDLSEKELLDLKKNALKNHKSLLFKSFISIYFSPSVYKVFNKKAPGLTKEKIKLLQASKLKTIKIKDGIPFLVSFFLAFLITALLNDNLIRLLVMNI
ncbi:MAG: A24 family peptidase [Candidatus Nanoarchaeia archaeon]|jgi:preflagellin peptidase FlaK